MCGLFGIYPKVGADALSLRILALFLGLGNVNRGRHSFGMWGSGIAPMRALGSLNDEDNITGFRSFVFDQWTPEANKWVAGHTRQATHGAKTLENTHPFAVGNIILAHNGVVSVEGYGEKEHPVDSGRIAMAVTDHGWLPGMARVSGSCALVVSVDDKLYLYRHNQVLHLIEEDWGWAFSSEKHTLCEAVKLAGLTMTEKPKEVLADHVLGPWEDKPVSMPCPAKAYVAPAYKDTRDFGKFGGRWVDGNWVPWTTQAERDEYWKDLTYGGRQDFSRGSSTIKGFGKGTQQELPLDMTKADDRAKAKHLKRGKEDKGSKIIPQELVDRTANEIILRRGMDTRGQYIQIAKDGLTMQTLMEMAFELKRHEKMLTFVCDPDTKITSKMITPLGVAEAWYNAQTEEKKHDLWIAFYAKLLTGLGVSEKEYSAALEAWETEGLEDDDDSLLVECATCDWCGNVKQTKDLEDKNFGLDLIKVCKHCTSDFMAARRGMDFRSGTGNKDYKRKREVESKDN